ncbi:MAG: hypothetical protein NC212_08475 [Staphylococcus sp.]|nr:hypothetical protein [Staphylococcus sp.]
MNTATGVGFVSFTKKIGSYTTAIQCSEGDLSQLYTGDETNYTCVPDFEAAGYDSPLLSFVVVSSRVAEGVASLGTVKWYFNDTEILFGSNGVSTNFSGAFEKVTPTSANGYVYPGIKVLKNLVAIGGFAPITIKATGRIIVGNDSDTVQASYTIGISQNTGGSTNIVKIAASNAAQGFTITEKGGSVKIKAVCYREGKTLVSPTALTYKWYKMGSGVWSQIAGATGSELTINEGDIMVTSLYMVEVYDGGKLFGRDTEKIVDASDCYLVEFHFTPATANISDDPDGVHNVNVKVSVASRKTGATIVTKDAAQALFTVLDPAGVILNGSSSTTKKNSQDVTLAMVQQAECGVQVVTEVDIPA